MKAQAPLLSDKELLLAKVLRSTRPVRGQTNPLAAVEWYETVRNIALVFTQVGSDAWYEFMGEAGYFGGY